MISGVSVLVVTGKVPSDIAAGAHKLGVSFADDQYERVPR
jgi:hypothetical protein